MRRKTCSVYPWYVCRHIGRCVSTVSSVSTESNENSGSSWSTVSSGLIHLTFFLVALCVLISQSWPPDHLLARILWGQILFMSSRLWFPAHCPPSSSSVYIFLTITNNNNTISPSWSSLLSSSRQPSPLYHHYHQIKGEQSVYFQWCMQNILNVYYQLVPLRLI